MNKSIVLRVLCAAVVLATLASAPESALAQRGGHGGGGGGGFRGGGGWGGGHYGGYHGGGYGGHGGYYGGYHGGGYGGHGGYYGGYHGGGYGGNGGYYGSYHGGGYYGGRGGYYGGRGGYWGYSGYGYGWGFGLGFSFGYGYPYGYATGWEPAYYPYYYYYPYHYPYYYPYPPYYVSAPASDPSGYSATVYRTSSDVSVNSPVEASASVARPPALRGTPNSNSPTTNYATYTPTAPGGGTDSATITSSNYRSPHPAAQPLPPLRPEVQNVIRALRGMPPDARQREIDSGRYSNLSPQELNLAKYAANLPPVKGNPAVGAPLQMN